MRPKPNTSNLNHQVHRCDLARAWLVRYGFPEGFSRRALVCRGVRHALSLIFAEMAREKALLWTPCDVYPAYLELARAAGIEPWTYRTLPCPTFPQARNTGCAEYLLMANPWKPLGRFVTDQECAALTDWLAMSPHRSLILDCVYDLGAPFHVMTRKLVETGKAILLHSATKGWLWPKTFGVALVGEANAKLESAFRNDPPSQEQLRLAERLLSGDANLPGQITAVLGQRKLKLLAALPAAIGKSLLIDPTAQSPGCYFFLVDIQAEQLLRQHQIFGIPASAFGGNWPGSILTSLSGRFAGDSSGGEP
jgi:aspartate/methionine/tyrosine aminotransferase